MDQNGYKGQLYYKITAFVNNNDPTEFVVNAATSSNSQ